MRRIAPVPIRMIWHPARDRDPAHAFLRTELAQAVGDVARGGESRAVRNPMETVRLRCVFARASVTP
jgi:hypothetical protein